MLSIPPQNYLAEEILLGCILINPYIFPDIISIIRVESFFLECHQIIYIHLIIVYKVNKLNPIEVLYNLSDTQNLYKIGGAQKIIELMKQSQIFISSNQLRIYINELVHIINSNYIKRLMIQYGYNIVRLGYIKKFASHMLYNKASQYLSTTVDKIPKDNFENLHTLIGNFILNFRDNTKTSLHDSKTSISTVKSGFKHLDNLTNGLPNGELIIIAARPSTGKTSLAINIAYNILKKSNYGICIFSLEMSSQQILNKLIAIFSNISPYYLANHIINKQEWKTIQTICTTLLNSPLHIHDKPNISIDHIEYLAKLWVNENEKIKLIIIDYLQLISIENIFNKTRVQELSHITRKLKMLAQYLNLPIITLSQLNRSIELRTNKTPILSDLRESGCISTHIKINIKKENNHLLYITNFIKIIYQTFITFKTKFFIKDSFNHNVDTIKYELKHLFLMRIIQKNILSLTNNHKCLLNHKWIKNQNFLDNNLIEQFNKQKKTINFIEYKYIHKIYYIKYSYTYDVTMINNFYFTCNNSIVHNSIEQDADIIIMLYDKTTETKELNTNNKKLIDVILSKNRNGPTGSSELIFSLDTSKFIEKNKQIILHN